MPIRKVSVVALLILSLGGVVALFVPNPLLSQSSEQKQSPAESSWAGKESGWIRDLDLSATQVQQLQAIRQQYHDPLQQNAQELHQARQELKTLMAGTASTVEVRAKFQQVQQLSQTVAQVRFESLLAMRAVLSPEQRAELAEKFQRRYEHQGRRSRRGEWRDR